MLRYRIQIRIGRDGLCKNIKSISITYCGVSTKYHRERIVIQEFVTAPSLRPVLSIAVDMRIRINGQQSLCNLLWNSKVETHHRSRERKIYQYNIPSCKSQMSSLNNNGSGDARKNTPDLFTAVLAMERWCQ